MHIAPARRSILASSVLLGLALLGACGSSDETTAPPGGDPQTAAATASPTSATVASGGSTTVTVMYNATGGLVIGQSYSINKQFSGITVDRVSLATAGSSITGVYTVSADATVPIGTHAVRFSTPVSGYTGTGAAPSAITATFSLTVE